MCGIAGTFGLGENKALLQTLNHAQAHRGPDGEGFYSDSLVGFAHLRLAFIDRKHGDQPIQTSDERYVLIYNGEVYNFVELRAELEDAGRSFKTKSDTEVVLQAYAEWGKEAFDRFNGMFAVAIYDTKTKTLVLARDHFGIKPLYYLNIGTTKQPKLVFASEIKAILASGFYTATPNERQVYRYLKFRAHEDTNETFFKDIFKLMPGEMVTVTSQSVAFETFSSLKEDLLADSSNIPFDASVVDQYKDKLTEAVRIRLISEVPVGTCLSGGLDSSSIALLVNKLQAQKDTLAESVGSSQNTFSAVFPNSINDETKYIDAVLDAVDSVEAHMIKPTADTFAADLKDFIRTQEEPTISTGPYAQYKVMQEAGLHVKALLDGQGADEMMAGYYPYYFVYWRQLRNEGRYGTLVKEVFGSLDIVFRAVRFKLYDRLSFKKTIGTTSLLNPEFAGAHKNETFTVIQDNLKARFVQDVFENSLPALLRYEDKNTMRFSIEGRVPFLDKEVMKFLFSLSDEAFIRGSWNKRILRDAMKGILPELIRQRRNKIGFTTPEDEWFKRLKNRFYEIFMSESFMSRPYFDQQAVVEAFEGYIKDRNSVGTMTFWRMINVELWMREFIDEHTEEVEVDSVEKNDLEANPGKNVDITAGNEVYRRFPLKTKMISKTDDINALVRGHVQSFFKLFSGSTEESESDAKWYFFISEKAVAITQGRSYFIWDIKAKLPARVLSRFVTKTPHGIGLGSPWTMQLAISEAGLARIVFASVGGVVGKLLGKKGWFYNLAGANVRAIDGPTEYSVYPSNVSAKLPPANPGKVAQELSELIRSSVPKHYADSFGGAVVIDANDIGRNILGHATDLAEPTLEAIFADNPLGQGSECTPLCVVFRKADSKTD